MRRLKRNTLSRARLQVTDMTAVGGWPYELPKGRAGIVEREACVRMMAPFASASEVWHEVRLISSPNGREPGKQVGRGVPLQLTMPAPSLPIVDQLSLDPITGEASAVLHWSAPATDASPIMHFNVQVEPLIYARTLVVESCNDQELCCSRPPVAILAQGPLHVVGVFWRWRFRLPRSWAARPFRVE